ncbi:MAG: ATP-binding protein [Chloroflexi bacterium]|nr:ATP-binding protein [Chloroflexota bacterium]
MAESRFAPWHQVTKLRDDLRSGELGLSIFAADLHDVVMGIARAVYQKPEQFFALTYPTLNLRELAKDVMLRLLGQNDRAVRQLELTYGGGKTHSLITLYHLVNDPASLPDLPAVQEFRQHAGGIMPPKARVVALCFDKFDPERGMEARSPQGDVRWLRQPWSVMAFQIAGAEGLRYLHAEGEDRERESPPAENLVRELLARPQSEGLATLVLIDEVLMFAREKAALDQRWRHRLQDFFQALTQAATKVDRACLVASLLATDPRKSDELGKEIMLELSAIFRREKEEGVQPVEKQDVAEVLRRRFFTPESIRDREAFRAPVMAALDGIQALDDSTRRDRRAQEERYLGSYPFHPELTEALYTKWTQLQGFQRTRGVLRTFAMALRAAESWDTAPLVGANVLLAAPDKTGLSDAAAELASVASAEEYEGRSQVWSAILAGELAKARDIQAEFPALWGREVEQAVMITFLHSQPIGHRALTRDMMLLLGATKPDRIELEKALLRWGEVSWFLDEAALAEGAAADGAVAVRDLPKSWRLGSRPNLRQMHNDACARVPVDLVDLRLREAIEKERRLTQVTSKAGTKVHNLPARPRDVEDDGEFHYVVLGPSAASEADRPSAEARRFIEETTTAHRPRVYRNAILAVVPAPAGLDAARGKVRDLLGWQSVAELDEAKAFDDTRKVLLAGNAEKAKGSIPDAVLQAYSIVVTVSARGEIEAFRVVPNGDPLFECIKKNSRSRIKDSTLSPEALLPGGPYDLWRAGETARRASDIVRAFAQFPHLPKMLGQKGIVDTLALGTEQGHFVLRLVRPDKSVRTIWRARPTEADLQERDLEIVLPRAAELTSLDASLLAAGVVSGLWPAAASAITFGELASFFDGSHVGKVAHEGYAEAFAIPRAGREVVEDAVREAVKAGILWLLAEPSSIYREDIPLGVLGDSSLLLPPPDQLPASAVLAQNLPAAWTDSVASAASVSGALSACAGKTLPWFTVRAAIDGAIHSRLIERTPDSGPWPCDWSGARAVFLRIPVQVPSGATLAAPQVPPPPARRLFTEAELEPSEIQDLVEGLSEILKAAAGLNLRFVIRLELGDGALPSSAQLSKLNEALASTGVNLLFRVEP